MTLDPMIKSKIDKYLYQSAIFADEPTGSLDGENSALILQHLLTDFGPKATVLIATHDPRVWNKCDRIIRIKDKKVFLTDNGENHEQTIKNYCSYL